MRVTDLMLGSMLNTDLQNVQTQLLQVQQRMASGNRINQPSDDPVGAERVLQLQSALSQNSQYAANAQDALSWLQSSQSALGNAVSAASQVRSLALQGATATTNPQAMGALAAQVAQLLGSIVDAGNAQVGGVYLFNGQETGTAPFTLSGTAVATHYSANATQAVVREIGPGVTVTLNPGTDAPSANVFQAGSGAGATGLIPAVQQILADMGTGGTPSRLNGSDLQALDAALQAAEDAQGQQGAAMQRVQLAQSQLSDQNTTLATLRGSVQGADLAKEAVRLQELQNAYQAALAVGSKLITPTLANYLP